MQFKIGDPVIHWSYGLGEIIGLEERGSTDQSLLYYAVNVQNLTVYVPVDDKASHRLRAPTSSSDFGKLFEIIEGPVENLSEDRFERKNHLRLEMADGGIENICRVVRDLSFFSRKKALNDDDKNIYKKAWNSLCNEWVYSLSTPLPQVESELNRLLTHSIGPE
jgi:RNA polymerase-interacting CarD/CdnL/TRCF family regulator